MIDDEKPRARAGKNAMALTPGLLMRAVMYSPKDFAAGFIALAAICAIVGNALFMQAGRHPSPMFGTPSFSTATAPMIPNPLPRPRPIDAAQSADKPLDSRLFDNRPAETKAQPSAAPRVEIRAESKAESKSEKSEARPERAESRAADPTMASLIRNASVARPAASPVPAANPNIPRPPASVPMRGDPLGEFISGRGR